MKKVVPARTVKKAKPTPSKVPARTAVRAKVMASASRTTKPIRKALVAAKPSSKTAVKPSSHKSSSKSSAKAIVAPPARVFPPAPKPNLSVKPMPKNPAVIIPPRATPQGINGKPGILMPKPVPKAPPLAIVVPGVAPATPVKVESTISPDKDLSIKGDKAGQHVKDRIVLMVPDPFWLHTYWEISHQSVQRAEAALGQDWHGAKPIIRLFDVTSQDTTSTSETPMRDLLVHGGCNHWYIDVPQPPRSYRVDIGYISRRGQFYVLARSNVVTPPKAGVSEQLEEGWQQDVENKTPEKVLAMSTGYESAGGPSQLKDLMDEQFRRPLKDSAFGTGATLPTKLKKFHFELDAELIVYGKTDSAATVTLQNEPVKLRPDGTFTMRFSLPDSRQIIPAVATAQDGMEERTIVLAVERNTKHLDPMVHDAYGEQ
ncbi:MAG: DUF4912 domain-containing protein [Gemmataceae bacterium]